MSQQQRSFKTSKGTELPLLSIQGKPYLSVQHRIMWFREDHPDFSIETEFVFIKDDQAMAKAIIKNAAGRILATGHKFENKQGFPDFIEKVESSAIGRALGFLGFGTQFAIDLEEGQRLADAPTEEKKSQPSNEPMRPKENSTGMAAKTNSSLSHTSQIGDYVVTFGKYKDKTIRELADNEGPHKISSYITWLENDAKNKRKPMGQAALDFIEHFDAFVAGKDMDSHVPKEELKEKLDRLKNEYPGVPGPKMPTPYKDDNEAPWPDIDPNEPLPF